MGDAKKKVVRRLKGVALGELRTAIKGIQTAQKNLNDFQEKWVDESPYFKDQVVWPNGLIFDGDVSKIGERDRVVIDRIPKDAQRQRSELIAKIEDASVKADDVLHKFAMMLGVNPKAIEVATGVITQETADEIYKDVDPMSPELEAPAEDDKVAGNIFDE